MSRGSKTKRRRWPPGKAELEALIEEAVVDAYGESEQRTGFYTMLEDRLRVPFEVEIPGSTAMAERIYLLSNRMLKIDRNSIFNILLETQ